jgi:hypothetical protein
MHTVIDQNIMLHITVQTFILQVTCAWFTYMLIFAKLNTSQREIFFSDKMNFHFLLWFSVILQVPTKTVRIGSFCAM